jgi:hypothetical protein
MPLSNIQSLFESSTPPNAYATPPSTHKLQSMHESVQLVEWKEDGKAIDSP